MSIMETETQEQTESRHLRMGWTASELARAIGVDPSRIRQLLISETIKGVKFGKMWTVSDIEAKRFIERYKQDKLD